MNMIILYTKRMGDMMAAASPLLALHRGSTVRVCCEGAATALPPIPAAPVVSPLHDQGEKHACEAAEVYLADTKHNFLHKPHISAAEQSGVIL